jgi:hypothetical protein
VPVRVVLLSEDPVVAAVLDEYEQDWFTTVVPRGHVKGRAAVVLISFDGDLAYLGRLEKTRSAATKKDGVRCSDLVEIDPPLPVDKLRAAMPTILRGHVDYRTLPARTGSQPSARGRPVRAPSTASRNTAVS